MDRTRTIIVDDHAAFRSSLRRFVESLAELEIVGEAGDGAAAVNALFDDVESCLSALDSTGENLVTTRAALRRGLEAAREVVAAILEGYEADPNLAGATAVNFLMLMGTVLGGWQLALGACAATLQLESGDADRAFLEAKLVTSEFFAEHLMPRIEAYRATAIAGSRNVMGLSREQLQRF